MDGIPGVGEGELMVGGKMVERVKALVYLGSELDWKGGCGGEVRRRVAAAAAAFERLKALWSARSVTQGTKLLVYRAMVRTALVYAAGRWALGTEGLRALEVFDRSRLRRLLKVRWEDRISNEELVRLAGLPGLREVIVGCMWRWLGHVLRMGTGRLPRRLLAYDPRDLGAKRKVGGVRVSWRRVVVKEAWEGIPGSFWPEGRKPHWVRWKERGWWEILGGMARERTNWRKVVAAVVGHVSRACGQKLNSV